MFGHFYKLHRRFVKFRIGQKQDSVSVLKNIYKRYPMIEKLGTILALKKSMKFCT